MRYVMVPVPAEHVLEVMRWVLFHAPDEEVGADQRNTVRLKVFLDEADDFTKSLLLLVATATMEDTSVRLSDAAAELDVDAAALSAAVRDLNATALGGGRPLLRVEVESEVGVLGNRGKISYLAMRPEHARVVRATLGQQQAAAEE